MAIEIVVPRLGWSMDEGVFGQWLKQEGEMVQEGDSLFELESDKATQDVESFDSGVLRLPEGAPRPGDTVKVGQCLGYLCGVDEAAPAACSSGDDIAAKAADRESVDATDQPPVQPRGAAAHEGAGLARELPDAGVNPPATPSARRLARKIGVEIGQASPAGNGHAVTQEDVLAAAQANGPGTPGPTGNGLPENPRIAVSPRAAARAAELGVDIAVITGSGRGGRIRERDVLAAAVPHSKQATMQNTPVQRRPAPTQVVAGASPTSAAELIPSSSVRSTIAERMLIATQQTAQVTLMVKTDATEVLRLRNQCKSSRETRELQVPSVTGMFVKLVAAALQQHPVIMHQWAENGLLVPEGVHIAVAVDTQRGLLAPVLRDVPSITLRDVTTCLRGAVERARSGQLAPEELQGGTFTLSNLGAYAVDGFTPILNLPQSAILGIGRIRPEPTVRGEEIVIRDQVSLSLTFDHRVYDGATAAAFLHTLCELLEQPSPWLIQ